MTLLEKGGARSVAFDFGFTPKSMSRMVPPENSFRSDFAMGELVEQYPNQVVLGCLYSGVQTRFVKPTSASAMPPFFYQGYRSDGQNFAYPESPTYPLINYKNGNYMGRLGSFSVPPYRAVDEVPRWVPLWYPGGGKAHAYNLLGGKKEALKFELSHENKEEILKQKKVYEELLNQKDLLREDLANATRELASWNDKKEEITQLIKHYLGVETQINRMSEEIETLEGTLQAEPALAATLKTQIGERETLISFLCYQISKMDESVDERIYSVDEIQAELADLDEAIGNFRNTLEANPSLFAVIKPQLENRITRRGELKQLLKAMSVRPTGSVVRRFIDVFKK